MVRRSHSAPAFNDPWSDFPKEGLPSIRAQLENAGRSSKILSASTAASRDLLPRIGYRKRAARTTKCTPACGAAGHLGRCLSTSYLCLVSIGITIFGCADTPDCATERQEMPRSV